MNYRKLSASLLSIALSASAAASSIMPSVSISAFAQESSAARDADMSQYGTNLALNKTATASSEEAASVAASNAVDGNTSDMSSRWGSATGNDAQWIYVDLGAPCNVNAVRIFWENQKATRYRIQAASSNPGTASSWTDVKTFDHYPATRTEVIPFEETVSARYIRLYIDTHTSEDPGGLTAWNSVSIYELEVYGAVDSNYQDPAVNVALNKTATADSQEAASVAAANAVDGDTADAASRWGSGRGMNPHWIYVDLGKEMDVQTLRVFWESYKATKYRFQTAAADADLSAADAWKDQKVVDGRPAALKDTLSLDAPVRARYVRLYIDSFTEADPYNTVPNWDTISLFEMQVFGGIPPVNAANTAQEIADGITLNPITADTTTVTFNLPDYDTDAFEAKYNGTDLEQVVDAERNIHKPVSDKTVKISFKVTEKESGNYVFKEFPVTIPGQYTATETDNEAPVILPELQEWKGQTGTFTISAATSIAYSDDKFASAANALAADFEEMTGTKLTASKVGADALPATDAIVFTTSSDTGLGEEGYWMSIGDRIEISATDPTGAYWGTRTILQAAKQGVNTINKGIARDYPTMKVRGIILDVGRKTFTMDFLRQYAKVMAWYKMNDFQIHLNDNYIQVNQYWNVDMGDGTTEDRRTKDVYAAFRLESNMKKGGDDGKNQEDLTAKDLYYTKREFIDFIHECEAMGVQVVPEIDLPAHALSVTRMRPDLHSPDSDLPHQSVNGNRSSADHLDLKHQYDEVMRVVRLIWDEYITGDDVVFDVPVVHIGADEYEASSSAYRKFVNDMFNHVEEEGYVGRVWGSLSQLSQGDRVDGFKTNPDGTITRRQINIWNTGWANPKQMYDLGFELINCVDGLYYIVPNAGYYYDWLNNGTVYNSSINLNNIPAGDEQVIGGAFAVWNDMCFDTDNGMSEYDIYRRMIKATGLYAANGWGKGSASLQEAESRMVTLNDVPGTDFEYSTEKSENGAIASVNMDSNTDNAGPGNDLTVQTATKETLNGRNVLHLNGSQTASFESLETVGLGNSLRVKVNREASSAEEQILFDSPYGQIKAVQKKTGKVGISRENRDYSFDYVLPVGQWVELEIRNEFEKVHLYVDGILVDTIYEAGTGGLKATVMFPLNTVGAEENGFVGYVDDIRVGTTKDFNSTVMLDKKADLLALLGNNQDLVDEAYALSGKYDPTAEEITEMMNRIDAVLASTEYEKADYTRLDSYLTQVPADTSSFTPNSVSALNQAVNMIERNLPKSGQTRVNQMTANLIAALNDLEIIADRDMTLVDQSTMTATASSSEGDGEGPAKAIDGTTSSMWHTQYTNTTMPHWLDVEFDEPTSVKEILYTPRTAGTNGIITGYTIKKSDDGVTYTDVTSGTLALNNSVKTIVLPEAVTARHIRLVATAASGNFASCSEINFKRGDVAADQDGLAALLADARGREQAKYGPVSYGKLTRAITEVQSVADNASADANAVEAAKAKLKKAIAELLLVADENVTIDYSLLETLINDITSAKLGKLSDSKTVTDELSNARALLNNAISQSEVDDQVKSLHDAWLAARYTVNKADLDALN